MDSISAPADVTNAPGALDAAVAAVGKLNLDTLEAPVRLHLLEQQEASRRRKSPHRTGPACLSDLRRGVPRRGVASQKQE